MNTTTTSTTAASGLQCSFCGSDKDLQRCGRCFNVKYCSKEHQKLHWKTHKKACKASDQSRVEQATTGAANNIITSPTSLTQSGASQNNATDCSVSEYSDNTENRAPDSGPNVKFPEVETEVQGRQITNQMPARANEPVGGYGTKPTSPCTSFFHSDFADDPQKRKLQISVRVIQDLTKYGICVIDNLLGNELGGAVLDEVVGLHNKGAFQDGQVVKEHKENGASRRNPVRGDKITWVEKNDRDCEHITSLIELVDTIIMQACRITNGKLGKYTISGRTKAMIACYPGHGTKYVKHVDNPNKDGRCVTAIYYLNKDWNTKVDGGLLRILPEDLPNDVADIEPIFDRLLFFWSDRRNPHEVQPAHRMRYALTLWYYDAEEKKEADARSVQQYS